MFWRVGLRPFRMDAHDTEKFGRRGDDGLFRNGHYSTGGRGARDQPLSGRILATRDRTVDFDFFDESAEYETAAPVARRCRFRA